MNQTSYTHTVVWTNGIFRTCTGGILLSNVFSSFSSYFSQDIFWGLGFFFFLATILLGWNIYLKEYSNMLLLWKVTAKIVSGAGEKELHERYFVWEVERFFKENQNSPEPLIIQVPKWHKRGVGMDSELNKKEILLLHIHRSLAKKMLPRWGKRGRRTMARCLKIVGKSGISGRHTLNVVLLLHLWTPPSKVHDPETLLPNSSSPSPPSLTRCDSLVRGKDSNASSAQLLIRTSPARRRRRRGTRPGPSPSCTGRRRWPRPTPAWSGWPGGRRPGWGAAAGGAGWCWPARPRWRGRGSGTWSCPALAAASRPWSARSPPGPCSGAARGSAPRPSRAGLQKYEGGEYETRFIWNAIMRNRESSAMNVQLITQELYLYLLHAAILESSSFLCHFFSFHVSFHSNHTILPPRPSPYAHVQQQHQDKEHLAAGLLSDAVELKTANSLTHRRACVPWRSFACCRRCCCCRCWRRRRRRWDVLVLSLFLRTLLLRDCFGLLWLRWLGLGLGLTDWAGSSFLSLYAQQPAREEPLRSCCYVRVRRAIPFQGGVGWDGRGRCAKEKLVEMEVGDWDERGRRKMKSVRTCDAALCAKDFFSALPPSLSVGAIAMNINVISGFGSASLFFAS